MKKFIIIFSALLLMSFSMSVKNAYAAPDPKTLTEGFYRVKDIGLIPNTTYKVRNTSPIGRSVVIIFDSNQQMQEFLRLEPNSPDYLVKPLEFGSIVIIIGGGNITFS
ncbi:hypothetical protein [Clostridium beijerinckii]|uniref:hypothetical protein n=1 Tax=Clostridium beijerinckii TaxID=1520 RepID=UPI0022E2D9C6|nr:hypothetical protein [Clostridium beijerinckii]